VLHKPPIQSYKSPIQTPITATTIK